MCAEGRGDKLGTVYESTRLLPPNQHHPGRHHGALLLHASQRSQQTSGPLLWDANVDVILGPVSLLGPLPPVTKVWDIEFHSYRTVLSSVNWSPVAWCKFTGISEEHLPPSWRLKRKLRKPSREGFWRTNKSKEKREWILKGAASLLWG